MSIVSADDDARTVSAVLYLNDARLPEHGGALLSAPAAAAVDIQPTGVAWWCLCPPAPSTKSRSASRDRLSLTGWLRRRNESLLQSSRNLGGSPPQ